ncbi:MAG: hypothetical protein ACXWL5_01510 [Candidatus Chromulinivorax sp.]
MKKLFIILCAFSFKILTNSGTNIIYNATGRTIVLNFYMNNTLIKNQWIDTKIVGPTLIAGKTPQDIIAGVTSSLLPQKIDMHLNTSSYITIDAFSLNSTSAKDKNVKGVKIPTPSLLDFPQRDYMITLQTIKTADKEKKDILVVQRLNTSMGIPMKSKSNIRQWPSEKIIAIMQMTPEEKIKALEEENKKLNRSINNLKKEISSMRNSDGSIKTGKLTQMSNRKKMLKEKKDQLKKNQKKIVSLQKSIAQENATTSTNALSPIAA